MSLIMSFCCYTIQIWQRPPPPSQDACNKLFCYFIFIVASPRPTWPHKQWSRLICLPLGPSMGLQKSNATHSPPSNQITLAIRPNRLTCLKGMGPCVTHTKLSRYRLSFLVTVTFNCYYSTSTLCYLEHTEASQPCNRKSYSNSRGHS